MAPFWHPLSTLLLTNPPCLATPTLLGVVLAADGEAELAYAGDRMWPAVAHGDRFLVGPPDAEKVGPGSAVVVAPDGIPDLLRVESRDRGDLHVVADADPELRRTVRPAELIAAARLPRRPTTRFASRLRRLALDLREAGTGRPDAERDPAISVRDKYEEQAGAYAASGAQELEHGLGEAIRRAVPSGGRVLVVGSGSGSECIALARGGFEVTGLDFAPGMIERAASRCERLGLPVDFRLGDLRSAKLDGRPLHAILFTYDVYSFLPSRRQRIEALVRLRAALARGGRLFLSARLLRSGRAYGASLLGLQWAMRRGRGEWGDSHTRYITAAGDLRRSYVHVFSFRRLQAEVAAGGFAVERWLRGHGVLVPRLL